MSATDRVLNFRRFTSVINTQEFAMEMLHSVCAGLDVHKKTVVACVRVQSPAQLEYELRSFGTTTEELNELFDWLVTFDCGSVVMESTGVYWKPVWRALLGGFELCLANAHEVKNVPGRKSDVKDAQWLADLLAHGLVRASYVPDQAQQELRDLTRTVRKLSQERARHKQRIQKVLESCNIKLASVISDVLSNTGRAIITAMIAGKSDPAELAGLAQGSARKKFIPLAKALRGYVRPHDRFMLETHLNMHDATQKQIDRIRARIEEILPPPFEKAVQKLVEIPGFSRNWAVEVLAEVGVDMSVFPDADHLVSWARLCPRLDSTAGKRRDTRTLKGASHLKPTLVQIAWAVVRSKTSPLRGSFYRLKGKAGPNKAIVAIAAKLLRIVYAMLRDDKPYDARQPIEISEAQKKRTIARHLQGLAKYGVKVQVLAA
jgi:transposase